VFGDTFMNVETAAKEFVRLFPEYMEEYSAHLEAYGEILGHVFFGDAIDSTLSRLLLENKDKDEEAIRRYIDFIEYMYSSGDASVQNVVVVTVLEYLGDDDIVLKNAFKYFSEDIIQASKQIEADILRRNIRIFYKNGKVLTEW
jgi:hypothetical protein